MAAPNDGGRQKQRLYRNVNNRIREVVRALPADGPVDFLCECGEDSCAATIELTHAQWRSLFCEEESVLLAAEHSGAAADGRRVIAENGRFSLVATA
jgi:hypothetical protein